MPRLDLLVQARMRDELPLLAVRDMVVFPGLVRPLPVDASAAPLLRDLNLAEQPLIAVFTRKTPALDSLQRQELYGVGCVARILEVEDPASGGRHVVVHGLARIEIERVTQSEPYASAKVTLLEEGAMDGETAALASRLREVAKDVVRWMPELPSEAIALFDETRDAGDLADLVAANLDQSVAEKAGLLAELDIKRRINLLLPALEGQLASLRFRTAPGRRSWHHRLLLSMSWLERSWALDIPMSPCEVHRCLAKQVGTTDSARYGGYVGPPGHRVIVLFLLGRELRPGDFERRFDVRFVITPTGPASTRIEATFGRRNPWWWPVTLILAATLTAMGAVVVSHAAVLVLLFFLATALATWWAARTLSTQSMERVVEADRRSAEVWLSANAPH